MILREGKQGMINGNTMTLVMEHARLSDFHQKMAHSQKLTLQRESSLNVHVIIHEWLNGFPLGLLHPYKWSYMEILTFQVSCKQTPQKETDHKSSNGPNGQSIQWSGILPNWNTLETPHEESHKSSRNQKHQPSIYFFHPFHPCSIRFFQRNQTKPTLRRKETPCTYAIHHPFPIWPNWYNI